MKRQLLRFASAGLIGFIVDAAVLYLMLAAGLGFYIGRLISFLAAASVTWQINRRYTFIASSSLPVWREWSHYLLAMSGGGVANYACYSAAIHVLPATSLSALYAVACGALVGMACNFTFAKLWVFESKRNKLEAKQ